MKKTIRVLARKVTPGNGVRPFYAYRHYNENTGEFIDIKFTQDAGKTPSQDGYFLIDFNTEDADYKASKQTNEGFVKNAVLWIHNCINFERDTEYEKELKAQKIAQIDKMF